MLFLILPLLSDVIIYTIIVFGLTVAYFDNKNLKGLKRAAAGSEKEKLSK
ncbi:MAG TPA: hypothetical protein VEC12_13025 [Bacteroidia bacterium]|nr:hypothetical protein [Bacteroidia bacterium]